MDGGDLSWKSPKLPKSRREQQRRKAELQHHSYALSGIDAMVPGEGDLSLGWKWLTSQAQKHGLPMLAANLSCGGTTPFSSSRVVERGGVRLGFVGLLGTGVVSGKCSASDPVDALRGALAEMGEVDQVVLLAHGKPELERRVAAAVPEVDLIIGGHTRRSMSTPIQLGGDAVQFGVGSRGKKVGVAEVTLVSGGAGYRIESAPSAIEAKLTSSRRRQASNRKRLEAATDEAAAQRAEIRQTRLDKQVAVLEAELAAAQAPSEMVQHRLAHQHLPLGEDIQDHAATATLVEAAKAEIDSLERRQVSTAGPVVGQSFMGSSVCQGCHTEQHAQWKSTQHAYAWSTLEKLKRSHDLDCWSCHVTGAQHPKGPKHPTQAAGLENVGCESCHGPGVAHVKTAGKAKLVRRPAEDVCTACHDGVKDEGRFEPENYFERVEH